MVHVNAFTAAQKRTLWEGIKRNEKPLAQLLREPMLQELTKLLDAHLVLSDQEFIRLLK